LGRTPAPLRRCRSTTAPPAFPPPAGVRKHADEGDCTQARKRFGRRCTSRRSSSHPPSVERSWGRADARSSGALHVTPSDRARAKRHDSPQTTAKSVHLADWLQVAAVQLVERTALGTGVARTGPSDEKC
jgi:hypothetical protein